MKTQIETLKQQLDEANAKIAQLREASNNFYNVFYNAVDAVLIIENDTFVDCNNATLHMLGAKSKEEVLNSHPSQLSPEYQPDGRLSYEKANEMIRVAFDTGFNRFKWVHKRLSGEHFSVEVSLTSIEHNGQAVLHTMWRDITMRKRYQSNLARKNAELNFQKMALDEHAIVSTTNIEGDIISANNKFCAINKYSLKELIGKNHRILNSDEHSDEFYKELWSTISSGKPWHGEIKDIDKFGEPYWTKTTIVPFLDDKGEPFQYMAIRTDITDRKEAEASALKAKKHADKANKAKSEFLSSMSHELRTPLNAIIGFGQLLSFNSNNTLTDDEQDYIRQIVDGGEHLLGLINDILDLTHIESGKVELVYDDFPLVNLIRECESLMSIIAKKYNIKLIIPYDINETLMVHVDPARFKQVIINLLSNAIKYNRDNGTIEVKYKKISDKTLRLDVVDNGCGIAPHNHQKIFEPFNRLDAERTDIEGTGIGLAVCKELIELMHGSIGVESQKGEGSTFWIEIPLTHHNKESSISKENIVETENTAFPSVHATLLYVEDNATNIELMRSIVSQVDGLTLTCAQTGKSGIEQAISLTPDIIILDINLPDLNGIQVLDELRNRKEFHNTPIFALSAAATQLDKEAGLKAGFTKYLTKPIQVMDIVTAIDTAINDNLNT